MKRVIVYLRTALFSFPGDAAHVPTPAMVLKGEVEDRPAGGLLLKVQQVLDHQGRDLGESDVLLFLPWSKVDHVQVLD